MNFIMIGFGYIATRHLKAIKELGHNLVAVYDPHNAAGILDSYFPSCKFFTLFEEFDCFVKNNPIEWCSICSPNYLHVTHIKWALSNGLKVICEKPVVIHASDIDQFEFEPVYPILQLRLHDSTRKILEKQMSHDYVNPEIHVKYHTPRGDWYRSSWKNDFNKSGGLYMNIGIHLFDLVHYLFNGFDNFTYDLSVLEDKPCRQFIINNDVYSFDDGFTNLHTRCYSDILNGFGFDIMSCKPAIEFVERISL